MIQDHDMRVVHASVALHASALRASAGLCASAALRASALHASSGLCASTGFRRRRPPGLGVVFVRVRMLGFRIKRTGGCIGTLGTARGTRASR